MPDIIFNQINYSWPLNNGELGALTSLQTKICNNLHAVIYAVPPAYSVLSPWLQPTVHCVVLQHLLLEKNLRISDPAQFKPVLFKGPL